MKRTLIREAQKNPLLHFVGSETWNSFTFIWKIYKNEKSTSNICTDW